MKNFNKLLLLYLILPASVWAETSLWRISKGDQHLFIGGTIHLLGAADYPLPAEYLKAFQGSSALVLEANLDDLNTPDAQKELMAKLVYPPGQSLKGDISPIAYEALEKYCKAQKMQFETMQKLRPAMVVITLTLAKLTQLGLADEGVDKYFFGKAKEGHKKIDALESAASQIEILADMGKGQESEFILSTLKDMDKMELIFADLKAAWREGDMDELEDISIKPMRDEFPKLYQNLLVQRNKAWIPKIIGLMATKEPELVLVGVLHLAGDNGVLAQLKALGYQVEKY